MDKLVSIITPCYNGEKYLEPFFKSVLSQNYSKIELIFIDDGSTDNTKKVVDEYIPLFEKKSYSFIYLHQDNAGAAAAINKGLKLFTGDYLMWIDSDDIMLPDNTVDKVRFLESHPDCGFVIGKGQFVSSDDLQKPYGVLQRVPPKEEDNLFVDLILERNVVFAPGVIMARREAICNAIPSLEIFESREGQNWQLMLPLAYKCKCGYLDKIVFYCVEHNDSHSRTKRSFHQWLKRVENFEILLTETINRIPNLSNQERTKYCNLVHEKIIFKKLELYNQNIKLVNSVRIIKEIKSNNYTLYHADNLFVYWAKKVKHKVFG